MTDRKKPGVAFWATVALVVALVGFYSSGLYRETQKPQSGFTFDLPK
ncbi:MAG TPA: hypothetical protein VGH74_02740 [Planctomycetaceae bacterium]